MYDGFVPCIVHMRGSPWPFSASTAIQASGFEIRMLCASGSLVACSDLTPRVASCRRAMETSHRSQHRTRLRRCTIVH
eukprot:4432990-Pyramimonas_sp.AAC.1